MKKIWPLLVAGATLLSPLALEAKQYKGAEIYTNDVTTYGKFVFRMKAAKATGVISNFFTYKEGSQNAGEFWEEIDIEIFGKDNATGWQSNIITGTGNKQYSEQHHFENFSFADDYHTFELQWTPSYVAWFVDGREIRRDTNTGQVQSLRNGQSARFNIWPPASVSWVGNLDTGALPVQMFVNWFEFHSWDQNGFKLEWRDDFDTFDSSRWNKASWTFGENNADFEPDNALVKDGTLVLALTREGQTGFSGAVPEDLNDNSNRDKYCSDVTVPSKIEAEDYCEMSGIQLEPTTDLGGGSNVGYTDVSDYLTYPVTVTVPGSYEVSYRVASKMAGSAFELLDGNVPIDTVEVGNTGDWQEWKTITHTISLNTGEHDFKVNIIGDAVNLNWIDFKNVIVVEDRDLDNDGVRDSEDNCPFIANAGQANFDNDAQGDVCDDDDDNDGFDDEEEIAKGTNPKDAADFPVAAKDSDRDSIIDELDNCPAIANKNQFDFDKDGLGNACDSDDDNDGFSDMEEKAAGTKPRDPLSKPGGVADTDRDGVIDSVDNCPTKANKGQWDFDKDGLGNACDFDDDNDGFSDKEEKAAGTKPRDPSSKPDGVVISDTDFDGIANLDDNCPTVPNKNQRDFDQDGLGNVCDADDDNDGFSDVEEKAAGTNPRDANSLAI